MTFRKGPEVEKAQLLLVLPWSDQLWGKYAAQAWTAILEHEVAKVQSNKGEEAQSYGRQSKNTEDIWVQVIIKLHYQVQITHLHIANVRSTQCIPSLFKPL